MPRTPRGQGREDWSDSTSLDETELIPRAARGDRRAREHDDRTQPIPRGGQHGGHPGGHQGGQGDESHRSENDDHHASDGTYDSYANDDTYDNDEEYRDDQRPSGARPAPAGPRRRRPRYRLRRLVALLALLLVAYLVTMAVVVSMVWGSINRVDAVPAAGDRPASSVGANYLLVGTDSREELTDDQRSEFATGYTEGHRADTVMLLNVPGFGDPTLVSLPRDSYVEIRGYGWQKLTSAHNFGGPELLVDTVEQSTGLRIDGYLEIGFGGFVNVVEEVGGVQMCLDAPIQDTRAHLDLPAGCQELTGAEALGYVRMRYSDPRGDLGRVERQREFLAALVQRMASPATVLNPVRLHQVGTATGSSLSFGEDTSIFEAGRIALAMRAVSTGSGTSTTVPVANTDHPTNVGSTVLWDEQGASALFTALRNGDQVTVDP